MNAAAKALAQGTFVSWGGRSLQCSTRMVGLVLLIVAVLASAMAVVYIKNFNRHLFGELQSQVQTRDELQVEWGQLLLEQNTWAAASRVQTIAEKQLGMAIPAAKDTVLAAADQPNNISG